MKKHILLITLAIFTLITANAQIERTYNWAFGKRDGFNFPGGGNPVLTTSSMSENEGTGSISDANGNLLFYCDGDSIWDGSHNFVDEFPWNNFGNPVQNALIIPRPGSNTEYYIIIIDNVDIAHFGVYDVSGAGSIVSNSALVGPAGINTWAELMTATRKCDGSGYWLAMHVGRYVGNPNHNDFLIYDVTGAGITLANTYTMATEQSDYFRNGSMKFSPDGSYLGAAVGGFSNSHWIFNFNNATGVIDIASPVVEINGLPGWAQGMEFSSNSKWAYGSEQGSHHIYSYDLCNGGAQTDLGVGASSVLGSTFQLGPDGNIYYVDRWPGENFGRIENANTGGTLNPVYIASADIAYGLPSFVTSFFHVPSTARPVMIDTSSTSCLDVDFTLDTVVGCFPANQQLMSWQWNFGDGNTSTALNPSHTYLTSGSKSILLEVFYPCVTDTVTLTVNLAGGPTPSITNRIADICSNGTVHTYATNVVGGSWSSDCGACLSGTDFNPITAGLGTHHVSYIITNSCTGLTDTLEDTISVTDCATTPLYIPNAFTPNGNNPLFRVIGSGLSYEISIYDRMGKLVFYNNDITATWDGTWQGQECNQGAYSYHIKFTDLQNAELEYTGNLTLIR